MSLMHSTKRALGEAFPSVKPGVETDKFGFKLQIDTPHEEWKEVIETLVPLFDEVGWLESLLTVNIEDGCVIDKGGIGNYSNGSINIEHEPFGGPFPPNHIVETSKEFILTHEMMHHAHLKVNGCSGGEKDVSDTEKVVLTEQVSPYSTTNINEAVAEIGAGIVMGYNFNDGVHNIYQKYGGPTGAYEIRSMCE